jgi:hypothetical protein
MAEKAVRGWVEPTSVIEARVLLEEKISAIQSIQSDLAVREPSDPGWASKAKAALVCYRREADRLGQWIEANDCEEHDDCDGRTADFRQQSLGLLTRAVQCLSSAAHRGAPLGDGHLLIGDITTLLQREAARR